MPTSQALPQILPSPEAIRFAWVNGKLGYKYKTIQHRFSEAWEKAKQVSRKFVLRASRRGRKSSWLLLTDFEDCISTNGFQCAFVAPVETALEEYILQISSKILDDCPNDLRPQWRSNQHQWYFPKTKSTIYCAGSNSKSYNNLRGYGFHRADVDEAGYHTDLRELVEGVLTPTCFDHGGYLRLSSSAPETTDHPFDAYWQKAKVEGFGAEFTIHDAGYPNDLIEIWVKEMGGWDNALVQREFMCRTVIDPERRIIPEWKASYIQEVERDEFFPFYHKYHALDTGVRDFTIDIMGYYDFKKAALILEDEILLKGAEVRTDTLANEVKRKDQELGYGSLVTGVFKPKVYKRIGDNNNLIILQDLSGIHGLSYVPTTKDELFAMVNEVRLWINSGRVIVKPKCKYIIGCLENGIWDKSKKEFGRSATYGHFDALAALCYLVRHIDVHTNPIPRLYGLDPQTHHIPISQEKSKNFQLLEKAIKIPEKRGNMQDWRRAV